MDIMPKARNRRRLSNVSVNVTKSRSSWLSLSSASATLLALSAMVILQPAAAAKTSISATLVEALGWSELPMWAMDPTDPLWDDEVQATLLGDPSDWDPICRCRAAKDRVLGISSSEGGIDSIAGIMMLAFLVVALGSLRILYKLGYEQLMDKPAAV